MKAEKVILSLVIITAILAMLLSTSIGYAAENNDIIKINDNPMLLSETSNFKIAYVGEPTCTGEGNIEIEFTGDTSANINITGLKNVGDSATGIITIENSSKEIYADAYTKVTNTNSEYFKVTAILSNNIIEPKNGQTTLEITVELIKQPLTKQTTTSTIKVIANPIV